VTEDAATQNEAVIQGEYTRRDGPDPWVLTYEIEKTLGERTSLFIEHGAAFNVGAGGGGEEPGTETHGHDPMDGHDHEEIGRAVGMAPASLGGSQGSEGGGPAGAGGGTEDGFQNLGVGIKQEVFRNGRHEAIVSLAAAVEAPTGTERIGSEDHAALEVLGLFAKGFGDVPASLSALRPLALQGDVRVETPLGEGRPVNEFLWNAALSYDLRVLHEQASFPAYLEPLAFVAEFNFATHLNGPARGESESFVTAGVIYSRENFQVGVALQFPMSGGEDASFTVLPTVAIFYDQLLPALGRNLFP